MTVSASSTMHQEMGGYHDFRLHLLANKPNQFDKTVYSEFRFDFTPLGVEPLGGFRLRQAAASALRQERASLESGA